MSRMRGRLLSSKGPRTVGKCVEDPHSQTAFRFATVSRRYAAEDKSRVQRSAHGAETNPIGFSQLTFRDLWRYARHYEIDPTTVPCVPWLQENHSYFHCI